MSEFKKVKADIRSFSRRKLICGFGINDAWYKVYDNTGEKQKVCPLYRFWSQMIIRSYSEKFKLKRPTYDECQVCEGWKFFSSFAIWAEDKDWAGKDLDKDIRVIGNKVYSPDTCLFVPRKVNNLIMDRGAARGLYPKGVSLYKPSNKFVAHCSVKGKTVFLGYHDDIGSAEKSYKKAKKAEILRVAHENPEIFGPIAQHAFEL